MVVIQFKNAKATIHRYQVTCDNPDIVRHINDLKPEDGFSSSDPDPNYTLALAAAKKLDGKIIYHDVIPYDPEVSY